MSIRTTLTLEDDLAAALRELAQQSGHAFRDVVNETLRRGLRKDSPEKALYTVPTFSLGISHIFEDKLPSAIIQDMDDQEFMRKLESGK